MDNSQNVNTALLVMDLNVLGRLDEKVAAPVITRLKEALTAARQKGIPVIYVVVAFRKGYPEVNSDNKSFSVIKQQSGATMGMEEPVTIIPELAPQPREPIVTKRRVSAFTGSDLEVLLRAYHVQHLVLTGFATSGVVLSTVREAADKDFRLTVLSDACADRDPEVHTVLLTKVFPRQAEVMTVAEWTDQIKA